MDPDRYLERLAVDPDRVADPTFQALERLQRAHVTSVPFETLSITGDPHGARDGEGIVLSIPALYEKVVERHRGGFCFELNGLFGWLLTELGFDVTRVAARMVSDLELPANHHPLLVTLNGDDHLVDAGMGAPMLRRPVPLGESVDRDEAGVAWRTADSDRPDAEYLLQYCESDDWQDRYVFDSTRRELDYFAATCDYLQSAPESGFTGDPVVVKPTPDGHAKLKPTVFSRTRGDETDEQSVDEAEYRRLLRETFGIEYGDQ
ncbi:arylamine n-acetyltransferase [Halogeometricum borinquense DSM 11551]|uniref:Arylamine N-acetyltransferase n=2 Tax=Halogeometricum borinquense TaxID=60847 RepID=E4NS37_HALBP|nr:arylamine N-acetyltransferase [Halogeometricum borinquense]ADQ65722.1 arylamine N-acetyltransferase [Halogeometricum borinquense DSM 11551]ELY27051.1 arylamine n-acetyltransferase [Halogeometricum borinquense DSM 11551]CBL43355.1 TPA: arylamine N-acetyltransferase 1 [Halogeometricum borinquense]